MYQGNAALSLEPYWEKPAANDERSSVPVYYYRARYYDPEIGQFISEDPLRFKAGINFYAYCNNNPINCNDPTGLLSFEDLQNIGSAFSNVGQAFGGALKNATGAAILTSLPGVDSAVEKRLATQFFFGKGTDFFLTQGETSRLNSLSKPERDPEFNFGIGRLNPDPTSGRIDVFDFDPQPIKLRDNFFGNLFDPSERMLENRGLKAEFGTRFGNFLGETFGGQSFEVFPASPVSSANGAASGGFVLYPNKPNTNTLIRVYSK